MALASTPDLSKSWADRGITQKLANLAFVNAYAPTGETAWGGLIDMTLGSNREKAVGESISAFKSDGGKVAISFGGQHAGNAGSGATGVTLANYYLDSGKTTDQLAAAYKEVYDLYKPSRLDFDIEGTTALGEKYIDFRSEALAKFQSTLESNGEDVELWLTLASDPDLGLPSAAGNVVESALKNNVDIDGVNIMAMAFGMWYDSRGLPAGTPGKDVNPSPKISMAINVENAAKNTIQYIKDTYDKYGKSFDNSQLGITAQIGNNLWEVYPQYSDNHYDWNVFSLKDQDQVIDFAKQNNVGMLSMWSWSRDYPGTGLPADISPTDSGLAQTAGEFSKKFDLYTSASLMPNSHLIEDNGNLKLYRNGDKLEVQDAEGNWEQITNIPKKVTRGNKWSLMGAEVVGKKNKLLYQNNKNGKLIAYDCDDDWAVGGKARIARKDSNRYDQYQADFGLYGSLVESNGNVKLYSGGDNIHVQGPEGNWGQVTNIPNKVTRGNRWSLIGAEVVGEKNKLLYQNNKNAKLMAYECDDDWGVTGRGRSAKKGSKRYAKYESDFRQDYDADGYAGAHSASTDGSDWKGIWYNTDQVQAPDIEDGTNAIIIFQPEYKPGQTLSIPNKVSSYKADNPDTKVYGAIGSGSTGLTKSDVSTLIANSLQSNLDGLVLEMEILGTGRDTSGWKSISAVGKDLGSLISNYHGYGKEVVITTGGSALTSQLACSLPGSSATCDPNSPLDPQPSGSADKANLLDFITKQLTTQKWDQWTPQIYDLDMHESWAPWQKQGYDLWSSFDDSKIAFSVGQDFPKGLSPVSIDNWQSMQGDLTTWLNASGLYPDLKTSLPVVGFPYRTATGYGAVDSADSSAQLMDIGVYGGGGIYKNLDTSIPDLKSSGMTEVIVWNIWVKDSGDLNFNMEFPLVTDGKYVGDKTYPDFADAMKSLKDSDSAVRTLNFGIGSSAGDIFAVIEGLIDKEGTGPDSSLYKNFAALKEAIPSIDALDYDDEENYDLDSMKEFSLMLNGLGYDVTVCPYMDSSFWADEIKATNSENPDTITGAHLQAYAGGTGNDPCSSDWQSLGVPVYPGFDTSSSPSDVTSQLETWGKQCDLNGAFMWIYDEFKPGEAAEYAAAIKAGLNDESYTDAMASVHDNHGSAAVM